MMSRWTVLNVVLAAAAALLAVEIARVWMRTVPPASAPAAEDSRPRRDPKTKAQAAPSHDGEADVAMITNLDVFDPSRQPPAVVTDVVAPVETPPPTGIELVGIRSIAGDQEAFIRDASQGNTQRRVRTGDDVAGYTVQAINATSVELGNATGQRSMLALQLARSGGARPGVPGASLRPPGPATPPGAAASVSSMSSREAANAALKQNIEQRWNQRRAEMNQQRRQPPPPRPRSQQHPAPMPPHA